MAAQLQAVPVTTKKDAVRIPESLRSRIFDPFFTTKSTGTGLGLPLTKQIVEAHGGSIACTPASPRGTRFTLVFPRGSTLVTQHVASSGVREVASG